MFGPKKTNQNITTVEKGSMLVFAIVIIFIMSMVLLGLLSNAAMQMKVIRSTVNRELAFQISEAGANYYQWHLAHFNTDYADGTGQTNCNPCGPYVHNYIDKDTNDKIGEYSLRIFPPPTGSTVVTIESTGYSMANPNQKRVVTVRYGIPSLAKYAFLTHKDVWIGDTESVSGQLHANGGIRFDGTGNAPITSAKQTYQCQTYHGCGPTTKPGIWGSAPQQTKDFWRFPVPNADFASMTSDLATLKSKAQTNGIYLPPSNEQGYSLVFNANGTMTVYKVTSLRAHGSGKDVNGVWHNEDLDYNNRAVLSGFQNISLPANGILYIEDKTWVEGTVNGRAMVVAAKLPYNANTAPSIIVPNNLVYLAKDGNHSLGLLAQKDILISYFAPTDLEIDAALVAQNGSAQNYYFSGNVKNSITIYGAVLSFGVWTWSWISGDTTVSGFINTYTTYDANLLYAPPPSFPITTDGYQQISWSGN